MLTGFLDYHRATLLWKASGLTQQEMATPLPSSELTIAGLVKHLALVEDSWFTERFAGQGEGVWAGIDWDADRDWEMHSAVHDTPEQLLELYREACERSRRVTTAAELDQRSIVPSRSGEHFTLRWILLHLIEETARHNGHVDLLREAIDGVSGE
jgi:uncharacterized damage-inducible protein DinB